jgi:hypothetical protein
MSGNLTGNVTGNVTGVSILPRTADRWQGERDVRGRR